MLNLTAMSSKTFELPRQNKDVIVKELKTVFSGLNIDIIRSVASQCNYDVDRSSGVLLEMTTSDRPKKSKKPSPRNSPVKKTNCNRSKKALDLDRVVHNIRQGFKVMVILRGLPGSGKSYLGRTVVGMTVGLENWQNHIFSTDDFFEQPSGYVFNPNRLQEAHEWNHRRTFQAMSRGVSPVVIDNTNSQMWEMKPYAMMATDYAYIVEILEPDTWWCFQEKELAKRNTHLVPKGKIADMKDRFEKNVTVLKLLNAYNLNYKFQKPPQFRLFPPVVPYDKGCDPQSDSESEPENLMEFSEIPSDGGSSSPVFHPLDDILMRDEGCTGEVLSPVKAGLFDNVDNAWGVDAKALRTWDSVSPVTTPEVSVKPETRENCCNVDLRDFKYLGENFDPPEGMTIIKTKGRDIGMGLLPKPSAVVKKLMVDKSCLTDDVDSGKDDEGKVRQIKDLFPHLPLSYLKELFERCDRNFNWTIDLLLDDNSQASEEVEETNPFLTLKAEERVEVVAEEIQVVAKETSREALELKKCIEEKIDIGKEHYSEHVYRVKQFKFGCLEEPQPSTSRDPEYLSDDSEDSIDDPKNNVEFDLGEGFASQLQIFFGGEGLELPEDLKPVVNMPKSLARQIYSLYVDSIYQQMEEEKYILMKEDEEFARKLQRQEEENIVNASKREETLRDIMDEQVALSLHEKDVNDWRNMTADTLADKLTRQKLFGAFPKLNQRDLLEVLHAYNNDYQKTVDVLIASVGCEYVNGCREAIKEPPLTSNIVKEMKEDEENYEDVELQQEENYPPSHYREEANKHLKRREDLYTKAKSYYQRGMTEVAMFYSELAQKETKSYEKANHIAASAFAEHHFNRIQDFDTLDLHYLYVKEAVEALDVFIDRHINLLRNGTKSQQVLTIITGRGKNSRNGRSVLKPAITKRLAQRFIAVDTERNPGVLKIKVKKTSPLTNDLH